ncbi:cytochrome b5 reductase 4-like isoform X2 [Ruditapes philippinarum]|nr:cytochrome b5 reductase 4-like isoform X2 [Ruditapes philippinarum]XP_060588145.1 cytochrome b5 reductase 4-like isoform X2 [Ruditapes philippinarum]XP_060588146.1 cytochrome b5 reductase 4-like isoform X2 [Ruditapes philippinarum]XP_060588147.1 cytochrome b5 reductase 4-like isoform X2 [Ruditapes philippinarum]
MGSQNLMPSLASFPAAGSQQRISSSSQGGRNKVLLKPGHSLMDWIKLGRSGKDLTGVGGRKLEVTPEELKKHNTEDDCWIALRGKVYNVTSYLDFHPGGIDELMRGAGKDATALFDEVHKWVNAESMLEKCLIGKLKAENPMLRNALLRKASKSSLEAVPNGGIAPPTFLTPSTPPEQKPRFDWYQSGKTVSVVVYTKWTDMRDENVIIDRDERTLLVTMHVKQSVFYVHIDLEKDVTDKYQVYISGDSGKVEIVFEKCQPDVQWSIIGKNLDKHNLYIPDKNYNPAYRDCTIEKIESITRDTNLYTICLPKGCRMKIPTGWHVHIKHTIQGMEVVRSYTSVLPSLTSENQDDRLHQGTVVYLMIKIYQNGAFTPWLASLKPGDHICMSSCEGNFKESCLSTLTHLVMLAAGTGFTPMVKLIYKSLVQDTESQRQVKLLFFNKTEKDILWQDQLSALADLNPRFTFSNCLSEAAGAWTGLKGRVNKDMLAEFIPSVGENDKILICVCGPTPFTKSVIQFAEELGHKDNTHAFLG